MDNPATNNYLQWTSHQEINISSPENFKGSSIRFRQETEPHPYYRPISFDYTTAVDIEVLFPVQSLIRSEFTSSRHWAEYSVVRQNTQQFAGLFHGLEGHAKANREKDQQIAVYGTPNASIENTGFRPAKV